MSFWKSLFGGSSGGTEKTSEPVEYNGFTIRAAPYKSEGQFQTAGIITKEIGGATKEHKFVRPSNGQVPERVCFIQCVGSRDRQIGNEFCSKVCCGIASKEIWTTSFCGPSKKGRPAATARRNSLARMCEDTWRACPSALEGTLSGIAPENSSGGIRLAWRPRS